MRYKGYKRYVGGFFGNSTDLIARQNIVGGDVVVRVWKRYCRLAGPTDTERLYLSSKKVKKGELLETIKLY